MAGMTDLERILHPIKVKLYPNYLPSAGHGTYIARTDSDKTVNIRDICTIMVTRTEFDGAFETLYDYANQFLDEVIYQLCDGFTVNLNYYTIHPNIGGVFHTVTEPHDHKNHPVDFRFSALAKLRALAQKIQVEVEGIADVNGYIDEYIDHEHNNTNSIFMGGGMFALHGHKIKIEGNDPGVGLYFVPKDDPSKAVKALRIAENTASKITGVAPQVPAQHINVEIRTQYAGSGNTQLKAPRVITAGFTLEQI